MDKQKVLVTGSTGALGMAIAREFAAHGHYLYLHYGRQREKAKNLLQELGGEGELLEFDLRDFGAIREALRGCEAEIVINNAGITQDKLLFFMQDDEWNRVIETNLSGTFCVTQVMMKKLIASRRGSIVNLSSISGIIGNAGQCNYAATKGGIIAFSKSLALEVARYGIRVNCVAPGIIESEMSAKLPLDELKQLIPLGRIGQPSEVARAVYFLAVEASYMTGEVMNVSGGMVR